jgi:hypothetical protein
MKLVSTLGMSFCVAFAIVACGGNTAVGGSQQAAQEGPRGPDSPKPKPPTFDGSEAAREIALGAVNAQFRPAAFQSTLTTSLKEQDQNVSAFAATYTEVPADLFTDLASKTAARTAFFQLMFRSDGSAASDGFDALGAGESLICRGTTSPKVRAAVDGFNGVQTIESDSQDPGAAGTAVAFKNALDTAVEALLAADLEAKYYKCSWSNHDDTEADAILSVDATRSTIRVLFVLDGG